MKTAMTLLEAAQHWVYGFNAIPTAMIARLMEQKPEEWTEVTMPTIGNTVYVDDASINGTITAQVEEYYQIILENGTNITAMVDDFTLVQPDILPMWSTMWSFGDTLDENWLKKGAGLTALSECGFRVFVLSRRLWLLFRYRRRRIRFLHGTLDLAVYCSRTSLAYPRVTIYCRGELSGVSDSSFFCPIIGLQKGKVVYEYPKNKGGTGETSTASWRCSRRH